MAYLIVERAGVIVERRKLDKDQVTIGRSPDSDIVLDDPQIGTNLAVLNRQGDAYVLEDQGSMAGVTHQNERVGTLKLQDGMRFEAFPFTFIYEGEAGAAAPVEESGASAMEATVAMDMSAPGEEVELISLDGSFGPFKLKPGVNVVGRKQGLDITIEHKMVSKEHAHVIAVPGEIVIEDRGSSNGTFVNRKRITRAPVRDGDLIQFGGIEFKVTIGGEEGAPPAAGETQDIQVASLLLGDALEQQAGAPVTGGGAAAPSAKAEAGAKKKGGAGRVIRLGLIGCLVMVILVVMIAIVLTSGGGEAPPPVDPSIALKLDQARGILQSEENYDAGLQLVEQVLASNAPDDLKAQAQALKEQLQAAVRRPPPIDKMTPNQLLEKANALVADEKILESVPYWERLVMFDPQWEGTGRKYSTLMLQIGLIYEGAGDRDTAIKIWKRALEVLPEPSPDNPSHPQIRERLRRLGERV